MPLKQLDSNLWVESAHLSLLGIHLGTRMTIIRLPDGGLWVHSPIALTEETRSELDALGPVSHIVCPNVYHHMQAGPMKAAYPNALLHGPEALARKRSDLRFDAFLSDDPHPSWQGAFQPVTIQGSWLYETVFVHASSNSIVSADLVENFTQCDHWPTRTYLKLAGLYQQPGWSRFLRILYRDRSAARASINHLLTHDFSRILLAHGDIVSAHGKQVLEDTYHWLK